MSERWFYAQGDKKLGPFSGQQLRDLADSRQILPTDTVWKEGVAQGVFATKVRYLFAASRTEAFLATVGLPAVVPAAASPLAAISAPIPAEVIAGAGPDEAQPGETPLSGDPYVGDFPDNIQLQPEIDLSVLAKPTRAPQAPAKKRKAVAVKGAIIVGQDGVKVRFRKKCATCNYEEASWSVLQITDGMMRGNFFCPKCRKKGSVEIRGLLA